MNDIYSDLNHGTVFRCVIGDEFDWNCDCVCHRWEDNDPQNSNNDWIPNHHNPRMWQIISDSGQLLNCCCCVCIPKCFSSLCISTAIVTGIDASSVVKELLVVFVLINNNNIQ